MGPEDRRGCFRAVRKRGKATRTLQVHVLPRDRCRSVRPPLSLVWHSGDAAGGKDDIILADPLFCSKLAFSPAPAVIDIHKMTIPQRRRSFSIHPRRSIMQLE